MKTKNNVQKAILRSIAVIISFVLLSFTVTAQGYWKHLLANTSFNQIATALVENTTSKNHFVNNANLSEPAVLFEETEKSHEIEPWMTDKNIWSNDFNFDEANETSLKVENWMINDDFFNIEEEIVEKPLVFEQWMTSCNLWSF